MGSDNRKGRGSNNIGRENGGRGHGNGKKDKSKSKKSYKEKLEVHIYYLGTAKQASDYQITSNFIINHIRKEFEDGGEDIAVTLKRLELLDLTMSNPTLKCNTKSDPKEMATEDKQFTLGFEKDLDDWRDRQKHYKMNLVRSYALIWEKCSRGMRKKIETREDYETTIKGNPIELLKVIKKHVLNSHEKRYRCPLSVKLCAQFPT